MVYPLSTKAVSCVRNGFCTEGVYYNSIIANTLKQFSGVWNAYVVKQINPPL
jgi:hypothetical protein